MSTLSAWGRPTWMLLHVISFSWDEKLIGNYIKFMNLISKTIPCPKCRRHFNKAINNSNLKIGKNCQSQEQMSKWLVILHNMVNKRHGKRTFPYEKAKNTYFKNGKPTYDKKLIWKFFKNYVFHDFHRKPRKLRRLMVQFGKIHPDPTKRDEFNKFHARTVQKKIRLQPWLKMYKKIVL